jgi:3-oxoacyl-[acyl-carrier protein] reductase
MRDEWILVTGGSRGIGRAIVEQMIRQRRSVVFTYLNSREAALDVERLADRGTFVKGYCCDGRSFEAVSEFAARALAEYGAPWALVNNAGVTRDSLFLTMEPTQWRDVIEHNLTGSYNIIRSFLPAMVEKDRGAIVQMSSVSGLRGNPGQANYGATKAGLIAMSQSLAREVGRFNIRVNVVAPGLIETEMTNIVPEKDKAKMIKNIPLRRLGVPADVAALTAFLISDEAAYITGQTFVVDGGLTA